MTFEKKWLDLENEAGKEQLSFSLWLNKEERKKVFEAGTRLRQSKVSTIIKQTFEVGLTELRKQEKLAEVILGNERKNRRSGLDELEIIQNELRKNLEKK